MIYLLALFLCTKKPPGSSGREFATRRIEVVITEKEGHQKTVIKRRPLPYVGPTKKTTKKPNKLFDIPCVGVLYSCCRESLYFFSLCCTEGVTLENEPREPRIVLGPTGGNPLQFKPEDCAELPKQGDQQAPRKKRRKRMRLYTTEQWADLVKKILNAHYDKGWAVKRIAKNFNVSIYRVNRCIKDPDYVPRMPNDERYKKPWNEGMRTPRKAPQDTLTTLSSNKSDKERAITDLMVLIPSMPPASAAFWLRVVADLVQPS